MDFGDLSHDQQLEGILSSINTEFKSIPLGYCLDDWGSCGDIRKRFQNTLNINTRSVVPNPGSFSAYCDYTFEPIGLVTKSKAERKGYKPTWFYKLNEFGEEYGKYAAALAIKTAVDFGLSMRSVLGRTASKGEVRSPYSVAKILFELRNDNEVKKTDLVERIAISDSAVYYHLNRLKDLDFIEYETIKMDKRDQIPYFWLNGDPNKVKPYGKYCSGRMCYYTNSTRKVAKLLKESGESLGSCQIAKQVGYKDDTISLILSHLEREGNVKRDSIFKGGEIHSRAVLKERGLRFVQNFLDPLDTAITDKEYRENDFREYYETVKSDLINYCDSANILYTEVCPRFKRKPKEERKNEIIGLLEKHGKLRRYEIDNKLGSNVTNFVTELFEERIIDKERKGAGIYYFLK